MVVDLVKVTILLCKLIYEYHEYFRKSLILILIDLMTNMDDLF